MNDRTTQSGPPVCIIGVGRRFRRDDQVGLIVAERLAAELSPLPAHVTIITTEAPCPSLFADLPPDACLILIDAAQAGADVPPGTVADLDYRAEAHRLHQGDRTNTHTLSASAALALAAELDMLPAKVRVIVIAAAEFGYGEELSPAVARAAAEVVARIRGRLEERA